jgi:Na+-transporting methylmalonyl-CoA/oxaloacetate decarboxylase beta subunit
MKKLEKGAAGTDDGYKNGARVFGNFLRHSLFNCRLPTTVVRNLQNRLTIVIKLQITSLLSL